MEEILKKRFELATHIQVELSHIQVELTHIQVELTHIQVQLCEKQILVFFNFRNRRGLLAAVWKY